MRTLVHLSDLHFGRVDLAIVEPLLAFVAEMRPDVVAVSGDLTQRARRSQFLAARQFLDRITAPVVVVPGNHDIPMHNPVARLLWPLAGYRRHITRDLCPCYRDDEIAVIGLNTARSLTTKHGRLNEAQLREMAARFERAGEGRTRIVVTHHPFDLPEAYAEHRQLIGRADAAMIALAANQVDLLLAGHLHLMHTGLTGTRYNVTGHSALVVLAGTALSTRGRGEANSFNVLRIEPGRMHVQRVLWDPARRSLGIAVVSSFVRTPTGWQKEAELYRAVPPGGATLGASAS